MALTRKEYEGMAIALAMLDAWETRAQVKLDKDGRIGLLNRISEGIIRVPRSAWRALHPFNIATFHAAALVQRWQELEIPMAPEYLRLDTGYCKFATTTARRMFCDSGYCHTECEEGGWK